MNIVEIYTDMSLSTNKTNPKTFGIGVFIIERDDSEFKYRERIKFKNILGLIPEGRQRCCGDLEMYAIFKALNIHQIKQTEGAEIIIYTDSDAAFDAYHNIIKTKNMSLLRALRTRIKKISKKNKVDLRCINGHENIYGNEIADGLASKSRK